MQNNGEVLIEIKNLKKSYGDHVVLDGINTTIKKGEVIAIVGPSGCGKSTFLRSLNKLERPEAGEIVFEGTDILDKKTKLNLFVNTCLWYSNSSTCSLTRQCSRILCWHL